MMMSFTFTPLSSLKLSHLILILRGMRTISVLPSDIPGSVSIYSDYSIQGNCARDKYEEDQLWYRVIKDNPFEDKML